jgi:hypothetical protein
MIFYYVLMAACGISGVVGIYQLIRGGGNVRPGRTIAAVFVFILAAVAAFKGLSFYQMRPLIENYIRS